MTPQDLVQRAALLSGFTVPELLGPSKVRPLAAWRHATMVAIRQECGWSLHAVADVFDRDHTTVVHAVKQCAADADRQQMVDRIVA
jgi:chromosomal replication initiation ATPase DnaA